MTPKDWRAIEHAWASARHSRETGNHDLKVAFRHEVKATINMIADRLKEIAHNGTP